MLMGIFSLILNAVVGFFTLLLLVRVVMRFRRMSFISPLGQFVLAFDQFVQGDARVRGHAFVGYDPRFFIQPCLCGLSPLAAKQRIQFQA